MCNSLAGLTPRRREKKVVRVWEDIVFPIYREDDVMCGKTVILRFLQVVWVQEMMPRRVGSRHSGGLKMELEWTFYTSSPSPRGKASERQELTRGVHAAVKSDNSGMMISRGVKVIQKKIRRYQSRIGYPVVIEVWCILPSSHTSNTS